MVAHAGSYGFQRDNRFVVFINGPSLKGTDRSTQIKRLALTCNSTNFPGRRIGTYDYNIYNIPTKMPNREVFSQDLVLRFSCSTDMYEAMYFKYWQDLVMDPLTNSPGFYNDFAKPFTVTIIAIPNSITDYSQLAGVFQDRPPNYVPAASLSTNDNEQSIYFRKCLECYPIEIVASELSATPNTAVMNLQVRMAFKKWIDPVEIHYKETYNKARQQAIQYDASNPNTWKDNNEINEYTVTQTKYEEPIDPPWVRFRKFFRDVVRISNPNEFRRVAVDQAADILGDTFGIENVESAAAGGQVIDVFRRNPDKSYSSIRDNLLGPISNIGLG